MFDHYSAGVSEAAVFCIEDLQGGVAFHKRLEGPCSVVVQEVVLEVDSLDLELDGTLQHGVHPERHVRSVAVLNSVTQVDFAKFLHLGNDVFSEEVVRAEAPGVRVELDRFKLLRLQFFFAELFKFVDGKVEDQAFFVGVYHELVKLRPLLFGEHSAHGVSEHFAFGIHTRDHGVDMVVRGHRDVR